MINAGFNPFEEISHKTGKSIGELKDKMSKGAISAEMVVMRLSRIPLQAVGFTAQYKLSPKLSKDKSLPCKTTSRL